MVVVSNISDFKYFQGHHKKNQLKPGSYYAVNLLQPAIGRLLDNFPVCCSNNLLQICSDQPEQAFMKD